MRRLAAAITVAAALAGITACSTDTGDTTGQAPAAGASGGDPKADLEHTVRTYVTALYKADADTAWSVVSQRCRERLGRAVLDADVRRRAELYGQLTVKSVTVDELGPAAARVSYNVGVPAMAQSRTAWVLVDGAWRWDNC